MLRGKGLWDYVSDSITVLTDHESSSESTSTQKNDLALACLMMSVDISCKSTVVALGDPAVVWRKLKLLYQAVVEAAVDAKLRKPLRNKMGFKKQQSSTQTELIDLEINWPLMGLLFQNLKRSELY